MKYFTIPLLYILYATSCFGGDNQKSPELLDELVNAHSLTLDQVIEDVDEGAYASCPSQIHFDKYDSPKDKGKKFKNDIKITLIDGIDISRIVSFITITPKLRLKGRISDWNYSLGWDLYMGKASTLISSKNEFIYKDSRLNRNGIYGAIYGYPALARRRTRDTYKFEKYEDKIMFYHSSKVKETDLPDKSASTKCSYFID